MPRFDNEGFNPNKRMSNDERDRSVPIDENYYANEDDFYDGSVYDNQLNGHVDLSAFDNSKTDLVPPMRSQRQQAMLEDYDDYRPKPPGNTRQRKNKKSGKKMSKAKIKLIGVLAVILAVIIIPLAVINGVLGKINYDDKRDNQYVSASELQSSSQVKNVLLLGVDARNPDNASKSRSDSMMLLSFDKKHGCVKMVSFLRDSWVYIPARDGNQRLNVACQTDGYHGVVDTIEYNFGVKIDGYVVADFEMFKVLVDSIGGVEVEVTEKEAKEVTNHKKRYGNVKLDAGKQVLNGEQALAYCRIRKIDTDFMRAYRQRTVMNSILKGVKSAGITSLYGMAQKSAPYIETDLSKSELMSVAFAALPMLANDMPETRVPFDGTWSYANINGASVIKIDADKNKEMLIDYIYNKSAEEIKAEEEEAKD